MTTLHTGTPPAQHGMMGYSLYLAATGVVVNMIQLAPMSGQGALGLSPQGFLPVPTLHRRLAEVGVTSHVVLPGALAQSSLTRMLTDGARVHGAVTAADLCVTVRRLAEDQGRATFIIAYWGSLDTLAHRYGPESAECGAEVSALDAIVGRELARRLGAETLLLITADHGQTATRPEDTILLHEHPALLKPLVVLPSGERRAVYLHVAPHHDERVRRYVEMAFGDRVTILTRDEAFASGLFGPAEREPWVSARRRVGDLILLANGAGQLPYLHVLSQHRQPWAHLPIGAHGGLTSTEMRVPLVALRGTG